jgi:hypothetical protein
MQNRLMTVTYRRAPQPDPGGGSGGGGGGGHRKPVRFSGTCSRPGCGTGCAVTVEPGDAIVIKVQGRTCKECNPARRPVPGAGRPPRLITIQHVVPSGRSPRVLTLDVDRTDKTGEYRPQRIYATTPSPAGRKPEPADAVWREAIASSLEDQLGTADWHATARAWEARNCTSLHAAAEALDDVWRSRVPLAADTTIVFRLTGFSPVVGAVVTEFLTRTLASGVGRTLAEMGDLFREWGALICAAAGMATRCVALQQEIGSGVAAPATRVLRRYADMLATVPALDGDLRDAIPSVAAALARPVVEIPPPPPERQRTGDPLRDIPVLLSRQVPAVPITFGTW